MKLSPNEQENSIYYKNSFFKRCELFFIVSVNNILFLIYKWEYYFEIKILGKPNIWVHLIALKKQSDWLRVTGFEEREMDAQMND